jgi:hypothetical protein
MNYLEQSNKQNGGHNKILSNVEQKYCNCLMHVRSKQGLTAPYGICTKSVYKNQKRTKRIDCDAHYNFSKYKKNELVALSREKKIKWFGLDQTQLANKLENELGNKTAKKYLIKKY